MANPLFDQLYAVGDSLSDSGGIYELTSELLSLAAADGIDIEGLQPIPNSPPYAGKFSNGPVLPEITAELLGAQLINLAFGGAEALGTQTLEQAAGPAIPDELKAEIAALPPNQRAPIDAVLNTNINLSGQMANLVAETSAHPPSAHSALLDLIGLNDLQALISTFNPSNPLTLIGAAAQAAQVAEGIVQADLGVAHTAFNQGIGTVIFETLPAPNFFPAGSELPPELQAIGATAIDTINLGLQADAAELRLEGHDARVVDLAQFTSEISADPAAFGFQNLDQPTLLSDGIEISANPAAPPPDQTAFFDPLHPTTKLHTELAEFATASLTTSTDLLSNDPLAQVEALYVGYFARAGDPGGVNFWVSSLSSVTLQSEAALFSQAAEAQAQYPFLANPLTATQSQISSFIASVYQDLFNRAPDTGGLSFWTNVLDHNLGNAQAAGNFILNVIYGAQSSDQDTIANKVMVAEWLTHAFAAAGSFDNTLAHTLVASVTADPATVVAAEQHQIPALAVEVVGQPTTDLLSNSVHV